MSKRDRHAIEAWKAGTAQTPLEALERDRTSWRGRAVVPKQYAFVDSVTPRHATWDGPSPVALNRHRAQRGGHAQTPARLVAIRASWRLTDHPVPGVCPESRMLTSAV